jgi:hypothetical protein
VGVYLLDWLSHVRGLLLDEARETFERLEALPWVERTVRVRSEEQPLADLIER